jgi:signal transduction histidine kinase
MLTTAHLNFQLFQKRLKEGQESAKYFEIASDYLHKSIEESRQVAHRLMPKAIEDYGYVEATHSLLMSLDGVVRIGFNDNLKGERFASSIELSLYRITQEAINNLLKYAEAKEVNIQLLKNQNSIILTIEDDGVGFDKKELNNSKGSFGLNGMVNRASSIGAQLYIDSSLGRGTQITLELPITKLYANESGEDSISG